MRLRRCFVFRIISFPVPSRCALRVKKIRAPELGRKKKQSRTVWGKRYHTGYACSHTNASKHPSTLDHRPSARVPY
ncbi:hypothetical protein B0J12DRAFT_671365 [Macrophomina phaseolina]|uniref:Secreted protein n=1 Tax=Macrophomina phaseolina TaxID=35725 RepID=A0ABQ8G3X1_9PEZI|nr:hypothetical protein B0J12DRAFT_671365 [Macrophomina phaseolina]